MKDKFYKTSYLALLLSLVLGGHFLFKPFKRQRDLDKYFKQELTHRHLFIKTYPDSDYGYEQWAETCEQMLHDGYTRAEIKKIDDDVWKKESKKKEDKRK